MNLFYQPDIDQQVFSLDEEESRHCVKVLRRNPGDRIQVTDGKGFFYTAIITNADSRRCSFSIDTKSPAPPRPYFLHIAISPTKNADRIEWFVEKCVEIGIDRISLVECKHTERAFLKSERLKKIALSAMKQSVKANLPQIDEVVSFKSFIETTKEASRFIAYVDHSNPVLLKDAAGDAKESVILIGPEGDFDLEELALAISNGFQKVSLGPSRLRTETAGMVACNTISLLNM